MKKYKITLTIVEEYAIEANGRADAIDQARRLKSRTSLLKPSYKEVIRYIVKPG